MAAGTVYLETTIVSYLTARPSRDILTLARQELTRQWWEYERAKYRVFVSQRVAEGAREGDPSAAERRLRLMSRVEILEAVPEIDGLARTICRELRLPPKAELDGYHLAFAVYYELDYLLTWNCTHLARADKLKLLARFCTTSGLWLPIVCTPEEMCPEREGEQDAP